MKILILEYTKGTFLVWKTAEALVRTNNALSVKLHDIERDTTNKIQND